jgi:hypothetical protein
MSDLSLYQVPDVVRDAEHELAHQLIRLPLDLRPRCRRPLLVSAVNLEDATVRQMSSSLSGRFHDLCTFVSLLTEDLF